ncbi:TPA: sulfite exporter TauE/SafE family protein [Staphylococcus aureus]|nr:sulfite exporter TauE/SafE family protein [Staphylococcus aureus]
MDIVNIVIMLLIGVFGGFISGLVGVGGAIIIYPAILLLPPLFGAPAYSAYIAYIASGLTSSQVFFSTLSGSLKARKKTEFSPQLVLYMGGGMIIGSMLGAFLANLFDATFVNTVYIIIALLALTLMFIKVKPSSEKSSFNKYLLVIIGLFIGIISGIVGAGGAFIIIPILLVLFKLPMNTVVANSIVIAFISSIGAFVIKLIQGYIPLYDALFLIIGSIIFAPIGLKLSKKVPNIIQKWIISILIVFAIIQLIL